MNYLIKKGKHFASGLHFGFHCNKKVYDRTISFSKECWWKTPRNNDDYDINKLCGFSYGFHQKNSLRIGWIPDFKNKNQIILFAYWHNNSSQHFFKYLTSIPTETQFDVEIVCGKKKAYFKINKKITSIAFKKPSFTLGYYLYPYFGGNNTAPNNMTIKITK